MTDIEGFLCEVFEEEFCSKNDDERKEFLSWFLNEDKNCILYEKLYDWVNNTLDVIIPDAPVLFRIAISHSLDYNEMRDLIFCFLECEENVIFSLFAPMS